MLGGLGAFTSRRAAQVRSDARDFKAVDDYLTAQMETAHIPGLSVAIVQGDQIVYQKGYGQADSSGRQVTPQTPFIIGSISKTFTALAVMQLVEAGKVELDAPVQRYLPYFRVADPHASAQITVRHLLNHTSGLPQKADTFLWTDQDDGVLERSVRYLRTVKLARPVGNFGYSNANYQTLGLIVQVVSGQSYEAYVAQHTSPRCRPVSRPRRMARHGMARGIAGVRVPHSATPPPSAPNSGRVPSQRPGHGPLPSPGRMAGSTRTAPSSRHRASPSCRRDRPGSPMAMDGTTAGRW